MRAPVAPEVRDRNPAHGVEVLPFVGMVLKSGPDGRETVETEAAHALRRPDVETGPIALIAGAFGDPNGLRRTLFEISDNDQESLRQVIESIG
jgi:hypothetical protein